MKNNYSINIPKNEVDEMRKQLVDYFEASGYQDDIDEKVNGIIESCLKGWLRAPKTFYARINSKLGRNAEAFKTYFSKEKNIITHKAKIHLEKPKRVADIVDVPLAAKEKRFLVQREDKYRADYEFNESADLPILIEVLLDELQLMRLAKRRLSFSNNKQTDFNSNDKLEKDIERTQTRLQKNMEKLGVLRSQRIDQNLLSDGSLAHVSDKVDHKLESISNMSNKYERTRILSRILEKYSSVSEDDLVLLAHECEMAIKSEIIPEKNTFSKEEFDKIMKQFGAING